MISRSAIGQTAQRVARRQCCAQPATRRGFATATGSTSFNYENADVNGIKVASRDVAGHTTKLAVVAKAGTRYELLPGLTTGLEQFAFKNTQKRSALRLTRESELLGGQLVAYHTREALVLEANFLREDLPFFTELLSEVVSQTKFTPHEFLEEVNPAIKLQQKRAYANTAQIAADSVHGVAFHRGLGAPLHPTLNTPLATYLNEESVSEFASSAYTKQNISVVANGASQADLGKWVGEFFGDVSTKGSHELPSAATKYYGGEERIAHASAQNAFAIAFPGSSSFTAGSSYKPEIAVLAALLGGKSTIKYSPGFSLLAKAAAAAPGANISTTNAAYSDAGLLTINFSGPALSVNTAANEAVKALKGIAEGSINKEEFTKAIALAKYRSLEEGQNINSGLVATGSGLIQGGKPFQIDEVTKSIESVSQESLKTAAKALLEGKASVAAVGDLRVLPFAEELGLRARRQNLNITTKTPSSPQPTPLTIKMTFAWKQAGLSYNKYLAVAARVVRRSLKEEQRVAAERRGVSELRSARWENGKQGEVKNVAEANSEAQAANASS
ncbi:hypothetical protein V492_05530 [Pseudogymnoascus sp. VKM F-4246]|nr:hypothetical protein V492_05530 [Pseudogymnoascus sp. VKM F-4246]